jgi:hypothetical protein
MWRVALILFTLAIALPSEAVEVREEYRNFIRYNHEETKGWWRRMCETFDVCERTKADINVALIIGVSDYKYLSKLVTTKNDAPELANYLYDSGEFDQVILLTEENATRAAIIYFMETYVPALLTDNKKKSRFLFYFSGHGEKNKFVKSNVGYLRLRNDRPNEYFNSINMYTVYQWANEHTKNAVHSLFLIDACMSGIVGQEQQGVAEITSDIAVDPSELIKNNAGILITAGTENQPANAHRKWNGSLFNKAVMDALQGSADLAPRDGIITSSELDIYVTQYVSRKSNYRQTPKSWKLREDEFGEFFFFNPNYTPDDHDVKPELPPDAEQQGVSLTEEIDREYMATTNVRVRRGPGTRYKVLKTLKRGERVWVTGKVKETNWYQVELDTGVAYIFARLLEPVTARIITGSKPPGISQPPLDLDRLSTNVQRIKQLQLEIEKLWAEAPKLPPADLPELDAHMGELFAAETFDKAAAADLPTCLHTPVLV